MALYHVVVSVTRRKSILDPEGKAIEHALHSLEFTQCNNVHVGKLIEFSVEAPDENTARKIIDATSDKLLANPIMEDYSYSLNELITHKG